MIGAVNRKFRRSGIAGHGWDRGSLFAIQIATPLRLADGLDSGTMLGSALWIHANVISKTDIRIRATVHVSRTN
jgi:hypothetical protein